jgi:hypothetical protein
MLAQNQRAQRVEPPLAGRGGDSLAINLEQAMRVGALDSAAVLSERLVSQVEAGDGALARRAWQLAVELHLARGEREQARRLAAQKRMQLETSWRGVALLELLELAPNLSAPGAAPNMVALSRGLRAGRLALEALVETVGPSTKRWLRFPELHLLFSSALWQDDRGAALRFLNRFLSAHGLPHAEVSGESGNALASLAFPPMAEAAAGALVSVLVAARNAAETIGYAVDSLLAQSHRNLEILVCDDGSTDSTLSLLQQRYHRRPRVRLFRSLSNQGPYNIRNALAGSARGELITFHDADDLALPNRIAAQVARLRDDRLDACVSNWLRVTPAGSVVFFKDQKATRLALVSLMMRRGLLQALGGFRSARFGADLELYEKLKATGGSARIGRIRAPTMLGLWSDQSLTRSAGAESLEDGYRSPSRRVYGELIYACHVDVAGTPPSDADVERALRATDNFAEPAPLEELG